VDHSKNELRKLVREKIAILPDSYISASNTEISSRVTSLREFACARNILMYCSVEREVDTFEITKAALLADKTVAFPYCYRGGVMQARIVADISELRPSMLGIPAPPDSSSVIAPEDLDLVIVPALVYDRTGFRLGYGGGYYDRFLAGTNAYKAGLARERLIMDKLPRESHDIAVDCIITEDRVFCPTLTMS